MEPINANLIPETMPYLRVDTHGNPVFMKEFRELVERFEKAVEKQNNLLSADESKEGAE